MSKLPVVRPRELINALKRLGFVELRSKGSHLQLKRGNLLVTVPVHSSDINLNVLKSILRQAKLDPAELQKVL